MKYAILLILMPLLTFGQLDNDTNDFSNWQTDYDIAISQAKNENKNLIVYFTGSDWCGPCKMLKKDLFAKDEFKTITESFVMLYVDIPRSVDILAPEQMQNNKELLKKLNKKGVFPYFKILSPKEKVLDEYSGYNMNGEINYHLEFFRKNI
ncbi:thioredoxin family protein [Aurantibacter crassamenti]|uniref:thioredoxin family protein n=1 Tax=Aurantibacter crassamenti TaxID=1837375 RepID=UPI00193A3FBD|nr:thioredoxin family protein [Aurantibacter crassamenti]MBM1107393.1 thioredoxin family protein [Aurantibacter crassamenti]